MNQLVCNLVSTFSFKSYGKLLQKLLREQKILLALGAVRISGARHWVTRTSPPFIYVVPIFMLVCLY